MRLPLEADTGDVTFGKHLVVSLTVVAMVPPLTKVGLICVILMDTVKVSPGINVVLLGTIWKIKLPQTAVTVQLAVLPPSLVVTVMTAVPDFPTAVMMPVLSTVATDVLLDDHVTVLSAALLGETVAVSFSVAV